MNRMYLAGAEVEGPKSPTRLRICVDRAVNSQSSMKSHRWNSDISCSNQKKINMGKINMGKLRKTPFARKETKKREYARGTRVRGGLEFGDISKGCGQRHLLLKRNKTKWED